jgi:hypothetical protein
LEHSMNGEIEQEREPLRAIGCVSGRDRPWYVLIGLTWAISYAVPHAAGGNVGKETP